MPNKKTLTDDDVSAINIRNLDKTTHLAFKAACAMRGRSMKGMVRAFINEVVEQFREPPDPTDKLTPVRLHLLSKKWKSPR